jgi:hypothetical protein
VKRIPNIYPNGGPLAWQNDTSGTMPAVMLAFFERKKPLTPAQFELVREWGEYYLNAPAWDANPYMDDEMRAELAALRKQIKEAKDLKDIDAWVEACLDIGIDPY